MGRGLEDGAAASTTARLVLLEKLELGAVESATPVFADDFDGLDPVEARLDQGKSNHDGSTAEPCDAVDGNGGLPLGLGRRREEERTDKSKPLVDNGSRGRLSVGKRPVVKGNPRRSDGVRRVGRLAHPDHVGHRVLAELLQVQREVRVGRSIRDKEPERTVLQVCRSVGERAASHCCVWGCVGWGVWEGGVWVGVVREREREECVECVGGREGEGEREGREWE